MSVQTAVSHDIADATLAAEGKKRIEWAGRNMPDRKSTRLNSSHT